MTWTHDIGKSMGISNCPFFRAEKDHMCCLIVGTIVGRTSQCLGKNGESEPKRDRLASEPEFCSRDAV